MSNNTMTDLTSAIFNLYVPKILLIIFSLINAFGNGSIVWVTIRKKSLRNPCNIFIAITSLSDFFAQGVSYPNVYYALSGQYPPLGTCWRIIVLPNALSNISMVSTLLIGVDRFIGIVFPITYYQFSKSKLYVPFVGILSLIYGFIWIPFSYAFVIENENLLGLCLGMLGVYATIWTYMKFRKSSFSCINSRFEILANASAGTKKIMKSVTMIAIVVSLTWPTSFVIITIASSYPDSTAAQLLRKYSAVLITAGISANYFIFYAFSTEYRDAFQRQLAILPYFKSKFESGGIVFVSRVDGLS